LGKGWVFMDKRRDEEFERQSALDTFHNNDDWFYMRKDQDIKNDNLDRYMMDTVSSIESIRFNSDGSFYTNQDLNGGKASHVWPMTCMIVKKCWDKVETERIDERTWRLRIKDSQFWDLTIRESL
jgi:hypothetical protein